MKEAQANLELVAETGYSPELRRNFSIVSLLGIGFGITNSWFGILGSLVAGISSGGPMMIIYGIIIVAVFLFSLVLLFPNFRQLILMLQHKFIGHKNWHPKVCSCLCLFHWYFAGSW